MGGKKIEVVEGKNGIKKALSSESDTKGPALVRCFRALQL